MDDTAITVLLADDDADQLAFLSSLVTRLRPNWKIVAKVGTPEDLERSLARLGPFIAILDVRLSDRTSLDIVRGLWDTIPTIYVTGDPAYAADAFTAQAVDFVVKPIRIERFEQALRKAEAAVAGTARGRAGAPVSSTVRIYRGQTLVSSPLADVRYFQAQRKFTRVVLKDSEGLLKMGFNAVEQFLDAERFWRVNRGLIINVDHMLHAHRDELGRLIVKLASRDEALQVARPYEGRFRDGFS